MLLPWVILLEVIWVISPTSVSILMGTRVVWMLFSLFLILMGTQEVVRVISPIFVLTLIEIEEMIWMISPSFVLILMETQEVVWMLSNLCLILMGTWGGLKDLSNLCPYPDGDTGGLDALQSLPSSWWGHLHAVLG